MRSLLARAPDCRVIARACPRFVPLIEGGNTDAEDPILGEAVAEALADVRAFGADTLILGCTHYPLIAGAIRRFLGEQVQLVDVAAQAADALCAALTEKDALARRDRSGDLLCWVTGSAGRFASQAERYLPGPETLSFRHTAPGRLEN